MIRESRPPGARCDQGCGRWFEVRQHEIDQDDGSLRLELRCPHCGLAYPIAEISPRGRRLRSDLRSRLEAAGTARGKQRILDEYRREVRKLGRNEAPATNRAGRRRR